MKRHFEQKVAKIAKRTVIPPCSSLPLRPLRTSVSIFLLLLPILGWAEVAPVAVHPPEATAWIGQRVPFFVELRARGSFSGTASFDLPQIPGTILIKIGSPVVGSQDLDGESWFVQTHEFALFSQRPGMLAVPAFTVRFANRDGFTGPAIDVQAQSPGFTVDIQRPPGSEQTGFLVTTESLDVTETWGPTPGPAEVGAVFKRTIIQRAPQFPGMALAPAPTTASDGIRIYPGEAATNDKLERGDFLGERSETITYLMQKPGTLEVPSLNFVWWNPKTEALQSRTLPAVTFEIAAPPPAAAATGAIAIHQAWLWLLAVISVVSLLAWQRRRLVVWGQHLWKTLNPPDRAAARQLLRACRHHDAAAAARAWIAWRNTQGISFQPMPELHATVLEMQRFVFGPATTDSWRGDDLARTFTKSVATTRSPLTDEDAPALPYLNA